jgi:Gly-Xaa carboxypeptidase
MARLLTELEDHPFKPSLEAESPYLKYLSCLADYAPKFPSKLAKKVRNPKAWPKLAKELAASDRIKNSFLATSTAIDLIHGGVKVNALPETVEATVNHRIAFTSNVNTTLQHYVDLLLPVTKKLGLTSTFFDDKHGKSERHVSFSIVTNERKHGLEPAPITPSDSHAFAFIGGAIRSVFGKDTVITPTGMFGESRKSVKLRSVRGRRTQHAC